MRRLRVVYLALVCLSFSSFVEGQAPQWIRLLEGYNLKRDDAIDAYAGTISRSGGPSIEFEVGPNAGFWVNAKDLRNYSWYREQVINGRKVRLAMLKLKAGTKGKSIRTTLLVTVIIGKEEYGHGANFSTEVGSNSDLADVLLMLSTFDPEKF